ncbi:MAG: hypothetical protein WCE68_17410 [Anaerolineales bacterium]
MRKNPFENDTNPGAVPAPDGPSIPPAGQPASALTPFDMMGVQPKARNRDYEKKNRTFSYRLTDREVGQEVANVALSLQVPVADVARAFVDSAIPAAISGEIPFSKIPPSQRRLTLYPTGTETWAIREQPGWPVASQARGRRKKSMPEAEKEKLQKLRNSFVVAYRWPASVDQALTELTEKVAGKALVRADGRKGWVLTILLRYALEAYEAGRIPLKPEPRVVKKGLSW